MKPAILILLALSPVALWQRMWKDTNSYAAAQRGTKQFAAKNFDGSTKSFGESDHLAPSPKSAFNLGTSQIASGKTTEGSATLSRAMKDPALRADSFFNRGNSALKSKAYEYAIRDYVETLKLRPNDSGAKRNLEIALEQLQQQQQQQKSSGGRQGPQQPSPSQQQQNQKSPSAGQKEQQQQGDAEALLRSVQQQEQEELQRMKRARGENVRVGW
jgi:hypothetical protein